MDKVKVFLLGGHDLEMITIKSLLEELDKDKVIVVDKGLSWETAKVSAYKDEIAQYSDEVYEVYGIELMQDVEGLLKEDNIIDHHGRLEGRESSLEQVCSIINHELSRDEELIAANDSRYISGMEDHHATKEEIDGIRARDRKAQGVSQEEEKQAEIDLQSKQECNGLIIIKTKLSHFSPIVDRIADRIKHYRLLICSDSEFTYYGEDKDYVKYRIENSNICKKDTIYSGGGSSGFIGGQFHNKDIEMLKYLCNLSTFSEHIFIFPFIWENNKNNDVRKNFNSISEIKNGNWERVRLTEKDNKKPDIYNEQNYFYPFTHDTIYDKQDGSHIRHFERKEPKSGYVSYVIETKDKTYSLKVTKMHLNFYSTGVGVLSIFTENMDYSEEIDILRINQFGRRIFVPFFADVEKENKYNYSETPLSLSIIGLDKDYSKAFISEAMTPNTPAPFIKELICDASKDIKNILPVLDDRMFVMSWYKCTTRDSSNNEDYNHMLSEEDNFLYKYIFVDTYSPSCQNLKMRQEILQSSIYDRWQQWGTLYGTSRYSFVMLTTIGCPDYLIRYFETEYERMAEMVLVQRASILRLSRVLKDSTNSKYEGFRKYYAEYIDFLSKFRFIEVSAQDQAVELYDLLSEKLRIRDNAEHLDRQFNEVQEYLELNSQRHLNLWAAILVPVSLLSAAYTFFYHDTFALEDHCFWEFLEDSGPFWLIASIVIAVITGLFFGRKN